MIDALAHAALYFQSACFGQSTDTQPSSVRECAEQVLVFENDDDCIWAPDEMPMAGISCRLVELVSLHVHACLIELPVTTILGEFGLMQLASRMRRSASTSCRSVGAIALVRKPSRTRP